MAWPPLHIRFHEDSPAFAIRAELTASRTHTFKLVRQRKPRTPPCHEPGAHGDHDTVNGGRRLPNQAWSLVVALCAASTVDWYLLFVVFWIAAQREWSGLQTAVLVLATRGPTLLGGLLGGRAVDAFGPRAMMLVDASARGSLCLVLAAAELHGEVSYRLFCLVLAGCAATSPMTYAAARTLMPQLVPDAQIARANTMLSLADQLPIIVSALMAGPVLEWAQGSTFVVPAILMAGAGAVAWRLPTPGPLRRGPEPAPTRTVPIWRLPSVTALVALSTGYFFVYGPFQPLLPRLVETNLDGDAGTYSLMRVLLGLGSLTGLLLAPRLCMLDRPGVVNASGAILYGAVLIPLVLTHSAWVACIIYAASGIVWGPYATVESTALYHWTPAGMRGRVFGTQRALTITAVPVGGALGSLALHRFSTSEILTTSAIACSLIGIIALLTPAIRRRTPGTSTPPRAQHRRPTHGRTPFSRASDAPDPP